MRCPFCGNEDSQVKDSRPTDDNAAIRRRRFCPAWAPSPSPTSWALEAGVQMRVEAE